MVRSHRFRQRVLIMCLGGLAGLVSGGLLGWGLGVLSAEATPDDPSQPFADLGIIYFSILVGLVLVPLLFVFYALRIGKARRALGSAFVFLISSAAIMGIMVRVGTLILPVDIGLQGGAGAVAILGMLGGAMVTARLIR